MVELAPLLLEGLGHAMHTAFHLGHHPLLLAIHAHGFGRVVDAPAHHALPLPPRDRAYTMLAEMLLMQHSCHWFCKSKVVASARLLARHQTSHDQVLRSVTAETRQAYCVLTGHPPG